MITGLISAAQNSSLISKLCLAGLAYFSPIQHFIPILLIFLLVDFFTGMYASYKKKVKFESGKLRRTLEKFVLYSISIILSYIFEKEFISFIELTRIVAGFIISVELFSIYENVNKITGLNLGTKVKDLIKNGLNNLIKPKKDK